MKKNLKIAGIIAVLVGVSCALAVMIARPTSAAVDSGVLKKAYAGLLYRCYIGGALRSPIENTNQGLWAEDSFGEGNTLLTGTADTTTVLLPDGWTHATDDDVSCRELFLGEGATDFAGINATYGMPSDNRATLEKLGYEQALTGIISTAKSCITPSFTLGTALEVNSNGWIPGGWKREGNLTNTSIVSGPEICFDTNADGAIAATGYIGAKGDNTNEMQFDVMFEGNIITLVINTDGDNWHHSIEYTIGSTKPEDIKNQLTAALSSQGEIDVTTPERADPDPVTGHAQRIIRVLAYKSVDKKDQATPNTGYYQFCNNSALCAVNKADANLFGSSNRAFTDGEITNLYLDYINRYTTYTCNENDTGIKKVKLKVGGEWKTCSITHAYKETFHGVDSAHIFGVTVTLDDVIGFLGTVDEDVEKIDDLDSDSNVGVTTPDPVDDTGEPGDASDVCYGSRGTLGMSWLLCPVMSWMANSLNWFYDNVVEDYVKVDTSITSNDDVYEAWKIFQNAANIVVVLILLVVIFSQLTGIGIDNYGIKKVLPRLIIFAIVVNLSYFIMQLLVDVSNIIGNSIGNIFQVTGTGGSAEAASGVDIPSNILGITVATSAGVGIAAVVANPAILLGLVLVLLSGLISVLMMWVILVTRQALILIAIIIAPIAFASYVLPNTRSFGKRWGSLVKDLLILFPEAAFLIGVSFFASKLLADANPAFTFPAILLRVMPFIALPELFRRSINAIDGLGNRLSSYGNNLSRGATGAMRGADWYKNAQERGIERRTRIRAGLNQDGTEATGWRGFLRSRNDRNRARYRSQYLKDQGEQYKADLLNDQGYMNAMRQKQQFEADEAGRDATKYTQAGYIEGKAAQGRLSRENEIEGARLYNTPGFEPSKRSQYEESRQSELRKMFTEQNLSQGTTADQRRDRLSDLLRNGLSGENDAAEAEALIDLLNDKGDIRQLIDGLNGVTTAQLGAMDAGLRSRIAGRAQATGNSLLKGWAKSVNRGNNISIDDYITRTGAGGLNNYITTDAGTSLFDNADKDTLEFLAAHNGARALGTNGAEAALASMATSAANASPRAANAINSMLLASEANNAGAINTIGSHITAENLAKMKRNNIATTFMAHAGSLNNAISTITQPGNEQLLSSMSNDVRATLGI